MYYFEKHLHREMAKAFSDNNIHLKLPDIHKKYMFFCITYDFAIQMCLPLLILFYLKLLTVLLFLQQVCLLITYSTCSQFRIVCNIKLPISCKGTMETCCSQSCQIYTYMIFISGKISLNCVIVQKKKRQSV